MTPEHAERFQASFGWEGVNTTGQLAWLAKRGYEIDVKAPTKALLYHKNNCGR